MLNEQIPHAIDFCVELVTQFTTYKMVHSVSRRSMELELKNISSFKDISCLDNLGYEGQQELCVFAGVGGAEIWDLTQKPLFFSYVWGSKKSIDKPTIGPIKSDLEMNA